MKMLNTYEIEILRQTASGYTAKEVARQIGLEHRTVESYIASIKRKLGAKNVANAIYIMCTRQKIKETVFAGN